MRGLLVAVVGILLLVIGLTFALRHMFEIQPGRREAAITEKTNAPSCPPGRTGSDAADANARCEATR